MNCIILAAGKNTRLDNGIPKSMLNVGNETLIERHLRLFRKFGVDNFCIVSGYRSKILKSFIDGLDPTLGNRITLIHNSEFERPNGVSLFLSRQWVELKGIKEFFFTMADHYFEENFVLEALAYAQQRRLLSLVVDVPGESNKHIDLNDVTKVQGSSGLIDKIGKNLKAYDYFDTGLFVAKAGMFDVLEESISLGKESITDMVQLLADRRQAELLEVNGHFWNDVDTPEDLKFMRELLS